MNTTSTNESLMDAVNLHLYQERSAILAAGIEALKRLAAIAQGDSGQCRHVAEFLLGLYNGYRFKFDLTDFRCLDQQIFNDCIAVLRMDYTPEREVHDYFNDGGRVWEGMADDWNIPDYQVIARLARSAGLSKAEVLRALRVISAEQIQAMAETVAKKPKRA